MQVRTGLRVTGAILAVVGGGLALVGVGDFLLTMLQAMRGDFPGPPVLFLLAFIGLPMFAIGSGMLKAGYAGAVTKYFVREQAPVAAEAVNTVVPATTGVLREAASAVAEGLASGTTGVPPITCPSCSQTNDADANFCDACGNALNRRCPACNEPNDVDANYCSDCGTAIIEA